MKTYVIPVTILKIQGQGIHLLIKGRINKKSARLIIDTGASQSVLDLNQIDRFHQGKAVRQHELTSTGLGVSDMKSFLIDSVNLQLGKKQFYNLELICLDLANINRSFEQIKIKPVDGVLGGDFFLRHKALIDYGKKQLKIIA
jgi:predicted aspartyl protease